MIPLKDFKALLSPMELAFAEKVEALAKTEQKELFAQKLQTEHGNDKAWAALRGAYDCQSRRSRAGMRVAISLVTLEDIIN
jgi:hypothetical protein